MTNVADSELLLPPSTAMSAVTLHVRDLAATSAYYQAALGLQELPRDAVPALAGDVVVLGRAGTPVQVLVHTPDLPLAKPGQAGLFHTALLYPSAAALAATVLRAARHPRSRFVGSADHVVSKAFYFTDPEGNGIELYCDLPRSQWQYVDGRVVMGSLPLDPNAFITHNLASEAPQPADVGHVHLKVGDIATARTFYVDTLGFEVMADVGSALFVAAGGYHHHLGVNTWQSAGAGPRAATIGLGQVSISLPSRPDVDALAARLAHHRVPVTDDGATLRFRDPWGSQLEVGAP
ncbi:MAG: VOC family protein [Janthinobacterium lividum]